MRVLVTGGAGYIGSVLVPMLLQQGHTVRVVDSFRYGNELSLAANCHHVRFSMERTDVRNSDCYSWADVIIPLAAIVGAPACFLSPNDAVSTNNGAIQLMMRSVAPSQMVVYPNTNSAYGAHPGICDESSPLNPQSIYAITKLDGERAVLDGGGVALRLATVFGMSPRMRLDLMVNDFMHRALRDKSLFLFDPHYRRNFVHVRDVAYAFIFAMNNYDAMRGNAYNVGQDSANMSKEVLCHKIKELVPDFEWQTGRVGTDPDRRDYEVSSVKIRALGYEPRYSLEDGLRELKTGLLVLPSTNLGNV